MINILAEFQIKGLKLRNRIVMPPMCQYSSFAGDGQVTDWHIQHYVSRAIGGAGLIIIEMTDVEPDGRITNHDLGLWSDEQIEGIRKIVDACHQYGAKVGIQIAHAGRKAVDAQLPVSASPIAYDSDSKTPRELTISEIEEMVEKFGQAARRAIAAGVDTIEIHGAHGYLIHQFQSRYTNQRQDIYGKNLSLFGSQVVARVKQELPDSMPLIMRISAIEYVENGYGLTESLDFSADYLASGVDIFHVSSGGEGPIGSGGRPGEHAGYQVPFAQAFKEKFNVPVIAVGKLSDYQLANSVIGNHAADLVAVGRGMLRNPYWSLEMADQLKNSEFVPKQYERAFSRHFNLK